MKKNGPVNPFYVVLVLAGIVFCVTACAYGVMAYRGVAAHAGSNSPDAGGLVAFMDRHGGMLLAVELAILAAATAGAIGLDEYRTRQASGGRKPPVHAEKQQIPDLPRPDAQPADALPTHAEPRQLED